MQIRHLAVLMLAVSSLASVPAQAEVKAADAIKYRQSGYTFMAWNMGRIKSNIDGTYNADDVIKAADAIKAIANSGMGALYAPGTETGTGWKPTRVKAEAFTDKEGVRKVAVAFNEAANEMARVAATRDAAAVKAQFGKLGQSCKGCHDQFRTPE